MERCYYFISLLDQVEHFRRRLFRLHDDDYMPYVIYVERGIMVQGVFYVSSVDESVDDIKYKLLEQLGGYDYCFSGWNDLYVTPVYNSDVSRTVRFMYDFPGKLVVLGRITNDMRYE